MLSCSNYVGLWPCEYYWFFNLCSILYVMITITKHTEAGASKRPYYCCFLALSHPFVRICEEYISQQIDYFQKSSFSFFFFVFLVSDQKMVSKLLIDDKLNIDLWPYIYIYIYTDGFRADKVKLWLIGFVLYLSKEIS